MNADMMKFLAAFLALILIYFLIGCKSIEQKVIDDYKDSHHYFLNDLKYSSPEVYDALNQ
jgi:hypothetical protein